MQRNPNPPTRGKNPDWKVKSCRCDGRIHTDLRLRRNEVASALQGLSSGKNLPLGSRLFLCRVGDGQALLRRHQCHEAGAWPVSREEDLGGDNQLGLGNMGECEAEFSALPERDDAWPGIPEFTTDRLVLDARQ